MLLLSLCAACSLPSLPHLIIPASRPLSVFTSSLCLRVYPSPASICTHPSSHLHLPLSFPPSLTPSFSPSPPLSLSLPYLSPSLPPSLFLSPIHPSILPPPFLPPSLTSPLLSRPPLPLSDCQLLRGLKYVHTANVLHRDLKPSNLLLNASCDLKICDFGLARTGTEKGFMTEYVVTRWYRAPELLLSCDEYSFAIDMWSVGCIFAELLGRKPLFPGKDYIHQLKLIINLIGSPDEDDLHFISSQKARSYIRSLPYTPRVSLSRLYPKANPLAINLIERMLVFDPSKRITVEESLEHPYLSMLHDPAVEPAAAAPFEFDFEEEDLKESALREKVWEEMLYYHPEMARQS